MSDADTWILIGSSKALRTVKEEVRLAANCDIKVLITGESGVGKENVARLVHDGGRLCHRPLVTLQCADVPDTLLESELFGHTRGSFTGAEQDRPGRLKLGHGGTLFLDEVGEMSLRMQAVFLRFLETGEIQRLGAGPISHVNVRVIAATNRNLLESVRAKEFREDLYYRLNVIHLHIPPLRERREDIRELFDHFVQKYRRSWTVVPRLSQDANRLLTAYDWPGNVRELRNLVERLMARSQSEVVETADLQLTDRPRGGDPTPVAARAVERELLDNMLKAKGSFWNLVHPPFVSHDLTRDQLRWIVGEGLGRTHGSYMSLVDLFNMPRTDYKRFLSFLRKYDCHMPFQQFRAPDRRPHRPQSQAHS